MSVLSATTASLPLQVLLVDDEPRLRTFLQEELEAEDYGVTLAADTGTAWEQLLREPAPDLVVLDWNLPDGSGPQLCQRMREAGITTPVLMLTGHDDITDRVMALDAGVDDYLVKPFSVDELLARLRALQRRRWQTESEAPHQLLRLQGLELNLTARTASVDGHSLDLLAKEYELLAALMQASAGCCTAAELLPMIWQDSPDAPVDLLEVYAESLQRKLSAGAGPALQHRSDIDAWCLAVQKVVP